MNDFLHIPSDPGGPFSRRSRAQKHALPDRESWHCDCWNFSGCAPAQDVSGAGLGSGQANAVSMDKAFRASRMAGIRPNGGGCVAVPPSPHAAISSLT
jgi:hypothetical protein